MKPTKTNAARILDKLKIPYTLTSYPVDENDLSAMHLAEVMDVDAGMIFKTLVLRGDKTGFMVCVIPGDGELALKKAAKAAGDKICAMIPMKDLQMVTGYIRGGCSPIGMKKRFPTFLHQSAMEHAQIYVSAGQRGVQLLLAPGDLIRAADATLADLLQTADA